LILAEQKKEAKSQSVLALDLGTAIRKLLKALQRVLARLASGNVVTIDISQTGVRIMETRGGMVRSWADASLKPEEMETAAPIGGHALGTMVRQLMNSNGIKAKSAIVSISGMYTVSRLIPESSLMPALTLDESVNDIASTIMPVPAGDLYFFWQMVNPSEGERQVFITGIPRYIMDDKIRALKTVGINTQIIELKSMALARVVNKEQALIFSIEPTNYDIIIVVKGVPEVVHSLAWQRDNMSFEDAAEYLAANLEMTVDFYNSNHLDTPFDTTSPLYITGEISAEPEMMEKLQDRLGFNIEQLTPPLECPAFLPISQYAANIGLAMRKEIPMRDSNGETDFFPLDMNLLPQAYLPWRPTANQIYAAVLLIAAITLIFPLMEATAEVMGKTTTLEQRSAGLDTQLMMKKAEIQEREPLQKAIGEYNTLVTRDGSFSEDIRVIMEEAGKLDVAVSAVSHVGNEIAISCDAEDFQSFRAYLLALEESGRFATPIAPPEGYPYTTGGSIKLETQAKPAEG
jgi:Tfp pilus assembly PilM family ATPase